MCVFCEGGGRSAGLVYRAEGSAAARSELRAVSETLVASDASGDRNIDALLHSARWASNDLTFTFPKSADYYPDDYPPSAFFGPPKPTGFQPATAKLAEAFRMALEQYEAIADLTFREVGATRAADITAARTTVGTPTASGGYPDSEVTAGDTWFNVYDFNAPGRGDYGWHAVLHEIGHTLGLKHGHESGGLTFSTTQSDRDSLEFSLMTYRSFVNADVSSVPNEAFGFPQTLMMYDIAAIQQLYGANFKTNGGNTVYTVSPTTGEMSVNGDGEGRPGANRVFQTIWDGGGTDTYDFSAYAGDQTISLAAGGWTLLSEAQRARLGPGEFARGNVFNALQYAGDARSLIENAVGGRGDDVVMGNQIANRLTGGIGDDTLSGSGGGDRLFGGAGADALYGEVAPSGLRFGSGLRTLNAEAKNNSYATAIDLGTNFSLKADPNIAQSTEAPHTSVTAVGTGLAAYYKIRLQDGDVVVADIDDASGKFVDDFFTRMEFRDADGNVLVRSDETRPLDPGSNSFSDASFRYQVQESGTYYIYLVDYRYQTVPEGAKYTLHVSLPDPNAYLVGRAGADTLDGGAGADNMRGGIGNDFYLIDDARDRVIEVAGQGTDVATATVSYRLAAGQHVETLQLDPATGAKALNLAGNAYANTLIGNRGANELDGGSGADVLIGGVGADALEGGAGADRFVFRTLADSTAAAAGRDAIEDFLRADRDRVDLRLLDADADSRGDQAFEFIGRAAFSGDAGDLRYAVLGGARFLYADVDGDRAADFSLKISAGGSLIEADFLL